MVNEEGIGEQKERNGDSAFHEFEGFSWGKAWWQRGDHGLIESPERFIFESIEFGEHFAGCLESIFGVSFDGLEDERPKRRLANPVWDVDVFGGGDDFGNPQDIAGKWGFSREHFEHDETDGKDVGRRRGFVAHEEFRREILRRSHDFSLHGEFGHALVFDLRDAKIEDFDEIRLAEDVAKEDVGGLEIAVNDAAMVGLVDAFENLSRDVDGALERETFFGFNEILQRLPLDKLHDEEEFLTIDADIDELDGVGMDERFNDIGFEKETL